MKLSGLLLLGIILAGCSGHPKVMVGKSALKNGAENTARLVEKSTRAVSLHSDSLSYRPQLQGELQNRAIREASGLAASRRYEDQLWVLNDGGNAPLLYAVGIDGSDRGEVKISGAKNRDWEDMASFVWDGKPYLLIADIGDNQAKRERCYLYFVHEPEMPGTVSVPVARTIKFIYEDGPRDAESVAVDVPGKRILILTKRDDPPVLYELPLFPEREGVQIARRLTSIVGLPQPSLADIFANPVLGKLGDAPTAMDISSDGSIAVVMTYRSILLYERRHGMSWAELFSRPPRKIAAHSLLQGEALALAVDNERIYYTSEQIPAPLWVLIPVPQQAADPLPAP